MSDFLDDKAAEGKDEEPQEDDEFAGLPEDEGEASDSGSSDGSGSSSDEDVSDGFVRGAVGIVNPSEHYQCIHKV